MHLTQNLISSSAVQVMNLADMQRQAIRKHSMDALKLIVINEIQQGDPALCSAFADFCATSLGSDTTVALCLSRIHRDNSLQGEALKWLRQHVDKCQELFVAEEVERRIATLQAQAMEQAQ